MMNKKKKKKNRKEGGNAMYGSNGKSPKRHEGSQ